MVPQVIVCDVFSLPPFSWRLWLPRAPGAPIYHRHLSSIQFNFIYIVPNSKLQSKCPTTLIEKTPQQSSMSKHLAKVGKKNSQNSDRLGVRAMRQGKNTQYTVYNLPLAIHQVVELPSVVASLSLLWYLLIFCLHANLTCRILPGPSAWLASDHTYKRHSHRTQEYLPDPVESSEYSPALEILKIRINLPECETDRIGEKK